MSAEGSKIIALNGLIGSGKSTVANILAQRHGFTRLKFSEPLKNMLRGLYRSCWVDELTIERKIEGDLKEIPCEYLSGVSPRKAMQTLGTEWGRDLIAQDLWTSLLVWRARRFAGSVVIEDCRFLNEAKVVRETLGGAIWQIKRGEAQVPASHRSESEQQSIDPDLVILNNSTLEVLASRVCEALSLTE